MYRKDLQNDRYIHNYSYTMNLYELKYSSTVNLFKLTNKMKHKQRKKTPCEQQQMNLEMQRQIYMLNLFVEFRFQLFNMKTLFDFKLRISAGMIDNLKTRNITLIPATFRSTKMFKNAEIFVPKEMLINTSVKMAVGFTNITSSTAGTFMMADDDV